MQNWGPGFAQNANLEHCNLRKMQSWKPTPTKLHKTATKLAIGPAKLEIQKRLVFAC
jgi:hypothetical protein